MPRRVPEPWFAAFGAAVRQTRDAHGLSQEELAERAGVQRTYVADVEGGRRNVTLRNIARLCTALEIAPGELLMLADRYLRDGRRPRSGDAST